MAAARGANKAPAKQAAKTKGGRVQKPRATKAKKQAPPVSEVSELENVDGGDEDGEDDAEYDGEDDARRESKSFLELGQNGIGALVDKQREQSKMFLKRFKAELAQKKQGVLSSMSTPSKASTDARATTKEEAREICGLLLAARPGSAAMPSRESSSLFDEGRKALDRYRAIIRTSEEIEAQCVGPRKSLPKPDLDKDEEYVRAVLVHARIYGEKLAEAAVFPGQQVSLPEYDPETLTGLEKYAVDGMAPAVHDLRAGTWGQVAWRQVRGVDALWSIAFPDDDVMAEPDSK